MSAVLPDLARPPLTLLSEEEQMFRDTVRGFAEEAVAPRVLAMDDAARIEPDLITQLFELGLMGIEVPEKWNGAGASFFTATLVVEEISRVDPSVGVLVDVQNTLVNNCLLRYGSESLQARYLPRLATEVVGAYALSEAGSGSDAFALQTRARGRMVAGGSTAASSGSRTAAKPASTSFSRRSIRRPGTAASRRSWSSARFDGFSVGKKEDKLGIRASSTVELILDGCVVPEDNVLGEVGKGYKIAIETLNEGRIGIGAQMVGLAQGALDHTLRYVQEREQFGRRIGDFQGVQFQLAEMRTELEAARLMVYNAARLKDAGHPFVVEGGDGQAFRVARGTAHRVAVHRPARRLRLHQGVSGGEAVP
jgi:alkylation response protein AidB-like acyl-CoA dehydrogenase